LALLGLVTSAAALARALRDGAGWAFENAEVAVYAAGGWAVAREMVAGPRAMGLDGAALREWAPGEAPVHAAATSIRGALLAAPVLGVFALLLSAADGAFASLVGRVFDIDLVALGGHALWTLGGGWVLAGYAAGAVFAAPAPAARADCAAITVTSGVRRLRIGAAEVVVAVALVDALLAAFVALQGARLFGAPRLGTAPGDGYAELARRGFFELSAVAALALPLLVAAASVVRRAAPGDFTRRAFRTAAGLLLALLGALLLSAADRMRLYEAAYGLTELRLYVLGFLAWLAAVFAWAAATLLRERPGAFALGGTVLAWAAVFVMHAVDPAALVVRVNASRAARRAGARRSLPGVVRPRRGAGARRARAAAAVGARHLVRRRGGRECGIHACTGRGWWLAVVESRALARRVRRAGRSRVRQDAGCPRRLRTSAGRAACALTVGDCSPFARRPVMPPAGCGTGWSTAGRPRSPGVGAGTTWWRPCASPEHLARSAPAGLPSGDPAPGVRRPPCRPSWFLRPPRPSCPPKTASGARRCSRSGPRSSLPSCSTGHSRPAPDGRRAAPWVRVSGSGSCSRCCSSVPSPAVADRQRVATPRGDTGGRPAT
jgi:hypothetical protein